MSASTALSTTTSRVKRSLNVLEVNRPETKFGDFIDSVIMGQPNGRRAARRAFRRTKSQIRTGNQPYYVIVAPGPTTSGKSELAYRIAEFIHENRAAVLKIDGSEYMEKYNLSKLTGASPNLAGYTNRKEKDYVPPKPDEKDTYAELSQHNLTWSRRGSRKNVTIVLIDEWDKGCVEFNNILLSIFRDGKYTLGNGEIVDFSNCIFILTANIGSSAVEEAQNHIGIGFGHGGVAKGITDDEADKIINDHLKKFAPPEFRARVEENGEIVIFHKLTDEQIAKICELKVSELCSVVEKEAKIIVNVDEAARKWLLKESGTVAKLNGAVTTYITDVLDNELIKGDIREGQTVTVTHVDGEAGLSFDVEYDVQSLITDTSSDAVKAFLAEADAELTHICDTAGQLPGAQVPAEVVEQLRQKAAGARSDNPTGVTTGSTTDGATVDATVKAVKPLKQPFTIQFQAANLEALGQQRQAVYQALASNPNTVMVKGELTYNEPFIAAFVVQSTLEDMAAIAAKFPFAHVHIVGGALS